MSKKENSYTENALLGKLESSSDIQEESKWGTTLEELLLKLLKDEEFAKIYITSHPKKNFSIYIFKRMEALYLTDKDVSDATNIRRRRFSKIKNGDADAKLSEVGRIFYFFEYENKKVMEDIIKTLSKVAVNINGKKND